MQEKCQEKAEKMLFRICATLNLWSLILPNSKNIANNGRGHARDVIG